jgi:hypothetical protein
MQYNKKYRVVSLRLLRHRLISESLKYNPKVNRIEGYLIK